MRTYPLYDLDDRSFEGLVIILCQKLLGLGTVIFSQGKDGGRDGKFTGTANDIPSSIDPWSGKFIIQAKHTANPIASCSDSEFQRILEGELPKILEMRKSEKIDYYLIFTNRKLSGIQDPKIEDFIDQSTGVPNQVYGLETINLWLNSNPEIAEQAKLNHLFFPLQFYENDLRELVVAFSKLRFNDTEVRSIVTTVHGIPIELKNKLNLLSKDYFDAVLKKSVKEFSKIEYFLNDPNNEVFLKMYQNTISDLQEEIVLNRSDYHLFDEILNHLYRIFIDENNIILLQNRKLIRVFLHYMYFYCDIGKKE